MEQPLQHARPDLDRDVKQGIQSQQINKELFKR